MKTKLTAISLLFALALNAQTYKGYQSDNYNGIHGVLSNPANIVDSRMRTEINLFSIGTSIGNNYAGVDINDLFKNISNFNFDKATQKNPLNDNKFFTNVDALLPSFMFNINSTSSVAVFSRVRLLANIAKVDGRLVEKMRNNFENDGNGIALNIEKTDPKVALHAWAELGATYAKVLLNKKEHFLKGGLSVKYLLGAGSGYISGNSIAVKTDNTNMTIKTNGKLEYAFSDTMRRYMNEEDDGLKELKFDSSGFGADIGFVYEWRPNYKTLVDRNQNKYKLKLGFSVTDIGKITYKDTKASIYDLNRAPVAIDSYKESKSFEGFLDKNFTKDKATKNTSTSLPTMLRLMADWNINHHFYLNINADVALTNSGTENKPTIPSEISLTPRFERKWFGFYSPLSYDSYQQFTWGAGFRLGPLFVGSSTVLSNMFSKNSKEANVYIGVKIPIYRGKSNKKEIKDKTRKVGEKLELKGKRKNVKRGSKKLKAKEESLKKD